MTGYRSPTLDDEGQEIPRRPRPAPPPAPGDPLPRVEAPPPSRPTTPAPSSEHGAPEPDWLDGAMRPLSEQDWSTRVVQDRPWLLRRPADPGEDKALPAGYLPLGKVGMLTAAGGVGKTMALLQLAVSVATGRPWLAAKGSERAPGAAGGFSVPEASAGRVLCLLAEEDQDEVLRRLTAIKEGLSLTPAEWNTVRDRLVVLPCAGRADLQFMQADRNGRAEEAPFFGHLRRRIEAADPWRLIILDPLSRLASAETETDNHHATKFIAMAEALVKVPGGPAVLLAHHTGKAARMGLGADQATAARGASALTDGVRWVANLARAPHENDPKSDHCLRLFLTKSNYGPPAESRPLERDAHGVLSVMGAAAAEHHKTAKKTKAKSKSEPPAADRNHEDDDDNYPV